MGFWKGLFWGGKDLEGSAHPGVAVLWLREILTLHTPGYR